MVQVSDKEQQLLDAVKKVGCDAKLLAAELNITASYAGYRIKVLKLKGLIAMDGTVLSAPSQNPAQVAQVAINKDEKIKAGEQPIVDIIPCDIDMASLIPESDVGYKYRNGVDDIIKRYAERNQPTFLIGEAGSGKTHAVRQFAADNHMPFLRVACDDSAVLKEFIGKREIIHGSTVFKMGLLIELVQQPSVILFDEFNALPAARLFFLHELLDTRKLFIKDAGAGLVVDVHPDCKLFLACNPNNSKYSGTNKVNVALADRGCYVCVPNFAPSDVASAFDCGNELLTVSLQKFYEDTHRVITQQNLRVAFSLRAIKRISTAIQKGDNVEDALQYGFYNCALLTATDKERHAIKEIARVCFGRNHFRS